MAPVLFTRRNFAGMISLLPFLGIAHGVFAESAQTASEVAHDAESIHQEIIFPATAQRVYTALTEARQFHQVVLLSDDGKAMAATVPTVISGEAGGTFALFGDHIQGRHLEMVPGKLLVQAWRAANWKAGVYSMARFELDQQGQQTKLVFDHTGFPQGQGQHLAAGWHEHYWEPLRKYLAQPSA